MSKVEQIENVVKELTPDELKVFRNWFADFDAELWDRQLESDVKNGTLRDLADRALQDHGSGRSTLS